MKYPIALMATGLMAASASLAQAEPAFVYANQASKKGSYSPMDEYAHNPAGKPIRIQRKKAGVYEVQFQGISKDQAEGGNVQVSAYGAGPEHCKVARWVPKGEGLMVTVHCFAPNGRAKDSAFSMMFYPRGAHAGSARFAWAGRATAARYRPDEKFSHNDTGGVQIQRKGKGEYAVSFAGVDRAKASGGNVQVTAYGGGSEHCKVARWVPGTGSLDVTVACYDASGQPADSQFTVLFNE